MPNLGEILRQARQARGLNQTEAGRLLGLKGSYLSEIEAGKKVPSDETLVSLAELFGLKPEPLVLLALTQRRSTGKARRVYAALYDRLGGAEAPERPLNVSGPTRPRVTVVSSGLRSSAGLGGELARGDFLEVPILESSIAAGAPRLIEDGMIQDWAIIYARRLKPTTDPNRYRCLWVAGESMHPLIPDGSLVCIDHHQRDPEALDRRIVALRDPETGGCTIKTLRLMRHVLLGEPYNKSEPALEIPMPVDHNPIVGRVAWWWASPPDRLDY